MLDMGWEWSRRASVGTSVKGYLTFKYKEESKTRTQQT